MYAVTLLCTLLSLLTEFLVYPSNVTSAPLGSTVTLECVAMQPVLVWELNDLQLIGVTLLNVLNEQFGLVVGPTEEVIEGTYRSTLSFDASVATNTTFNYIRCLAGSTYFQLFSGPLVYITVYGEFTLLLLLYLV